MSREQLKHNVYMEMANSISKLGTCLRLQVGCILLSKSGSLVSAGCNGVGPGMLHCHSDICNADKRCLRCAHAEENALANMSDVPYTAYITHEPCGACTRRLIQSGVRNIYFNTPYTSMTADEAKARQEWLDFYEVILTHV